MILAAREDVFGAARAGYATVDVVFSTYPAPVGFRAFVVDGVLALGGGGGFLWGRLIWFR